MIFNSTSNNQQNSKTTINNELCKQLEIDVSFIKELFNLSLNPTCSEVENIKQTISNFIQNTKYFIDLLRNFAQLRPKHKQIIPKQMNNLKFCLKQFF